tara:strand:+ start:67 stop:345 length:279 start_codon:yes stop_codon:yes gene_type:complete
MAPILLLTQQQPQVEEVHLVEIKMVVTEALEEVEEDLNLIEGLVVQEQVGKEMMAVMEAQIIEAVEVEEKALLVVTLIRVMGLEALDMIGSL